MPTDLKRLVPVSREAFELWRSGHEKENNGYFDWVWPMGRSYTERVETTSDLCASAQRAICEGRKSVFVTQKIDSDQN